MLIIMLTGLSGAGKSTLALALREQLNAAGFNVAVIDGDQYRHTLNKDLGFSEADRRENIRRLLEVAKESQQAGAVTLIAAINPFEDQRLQITAATGALVIYVKCALELLIERDTKGLYKRALLPATDPQKLHNLSGVNDRYDEPLHPDLTIDTGAEAVDVAARRCFEFIISTLNPA